jgi:hypothetical protein
MGIRTVRLDEEAEQALREIQASTGMPVSTALKRGLAALRDSVRQTMTTQSYEIYSRLDLGPGGCASGPSTQSRAAAHRAIAKRVGR